MTTPEFDLFVVGGGINGAGIARDAAGRGLSVLLAEAQDLAGATSSASTKLIHGGLRYLEYYEFRLVREALREREVLLHNAPHIIRPLEFVLPHDAHLRPAWMIRAGLFLYDHMGRRRVLKGSRGLNLRKHAHGAPLQDQYKRGFSYADCWVDDARLVVLNALDAHERGATILTRMACTGIVPHKDHWVIHLKNLFTDQQRTVTAQKVVNATGPWVDGFLDACTLTTPDTPRVRLVKGSHIIVPRLYDGPQCYILQQPDGRIVFTIPYERSYTLIGTTDVDYTGAPSAAAIEQDEIYYLCDAVNRSFKNQIGADNIVSTYSGVRPLFDDGDSNAAAVTRDYKLVKDDSKGAEILSVFGGKITTYRKLAEHAVDDLFGRKAWTQDMPLPGGDIPRADFKSFAQQQAHRYSWLPDRLLVRYARLYGTRMDKVIGEAESLEGLGTHFGDDMYEAEVKYLIHTEWARTALDVLYRRTKQGLHIRQATQDALEAYINETVERMIHR